MSFSTPFALALLGVLPLLVVGYVVLERRRRRGAARFASPALTPNLVARRPGLRRHLPSAIVLLALALLLVGVARPNIVRTVTRDEATIVLAIDVSRSMAADDVTPSRLEAARAAASELLETVPDNYRVGLVTFSTTADVALSPTTDRDAAAVALRELRLGSGTAIGDAIDRSLQLAAVDPVSAEAGKRSPAAILLLSDGAQTAQSATPAAAAERARRAGVPVSTVALGTEDAVVEVPRPGGLVERVTVPPDVPTMRRIAEVTGGTFFEVLEAERLREVYRELGTRLVSERKRVEITSTFAVTGAALALLAGALSSLWFRRAL
ncbi:MAG: VWA domain-containing protein [Gaiella sp.]